MVKVTGIRTIVNFGSTDDKKILLNNASDESYIFNLISFSFEPLTINTKQTLKTSFQRRDQYHFYPYSDLDYLVFSESTSEKEHPHRVYNLSLKGSPLLSEIDPLNLHGREILSILLTEEVKIKLLTNYLDKSFIEQIDPYTRGIVHSKPLSRKYELGDRLQVVNNNLLIVRHLRNEIVDVDTEDYIKIAGSINNLAIPEISSTWEVPKYLYVSSS